MNDKLKIYLEDHIALCMERSRALAGDSRGDEANLEKIRANVYEIFRTVLSAGEKAQADPERAMAFFLDRLETIPAAWQTALYKAREHGDDARAAIELIKLEVAADIKAAALGEVEA